MDRHDAIRRASILVPVVGLVVLALSWGRHPAVPVAVLMAGLHVVLVLAAVVHAEAIAHRLGEPFGTLVLAVAVAVATGRSAHQRVVGSVLALGLALVGALGISTLRSYGLL